MAKKAAGILSPSLPQKNNLIERAEREAQLAVTRDVYDYSTQTGLPMPMAATKAAIVQLPGLVDWVEGQGVNQAKIFADLTLWKFETASVDNFSSLADYAKVFTIFTTPDIVETWQDDRIFASQRLGGLNPMAVNRVTEDGSVGVGWAALSRKLSPSISGQPIQPPVGPQITIQQAIQQGRLYVTDYVALQAAVASPTAPGWQKGQHLMAPLGLFVRTDDFPGLRPFAIQLGQTPDSPVFLASDSSQPGKLYPWLMAKIFLQAADLNLNQTVNHLCFTHLIEEAFALAMHRRLAWQHPLYCLLQHHFAALLVINQLGVLTLINSTGIVQQILEGGLSGSLQLITNAYQDWTFENMDFPQDLSKRGVDNTQMLPYFPYRDDGRLIWDCLGAYVKDYLDLYYRSDKDVVRDYELQNWAQQLSGALDSASGRVPGFPESIATRDQLAQIVQRIVWTAGPQHAAVNFPQTEFTTFIPNSVGATYTPPVRGEVNEKTLLQMLAPKAETEVQVKASYALAGYRYDQLLDYKLDSEDGSQAIVAKYHDQLTTTVRNTIVSRNQQRSGQEGLLAYPYFLPENIPNSTSV
ncbi:MAG TPA: lipoxygenase family protein [Candidatus Methylomirabilis sp.]|nr:lipoxygenase family protein [Candidatus Methylomirabilis sp.]